MTAARSDAIPPAGGWTTGDLDELPVDGHRRELIDGVLIMTPTPSYIHQTMASLLLSALSVTCPDEFVVTQAVEVRVNTRQSFIPDVLAVTAEAARQLPSKFTADQVVLAVEIVSPGSQTLDRHAKPALYAEAGVPVFWRIETNPIIEVHTFHLDAHDRRYAATGRFTSSIATELPWPLVVPISHFTPRFFRAGH